MGSLREGKGICCSARERHRQIPESDPDVEPFRSCSRFVLETRAAIAILIPYA